VPLVVLAGPAVTPLAQLLVVLAGPAEPVEMAVASLPLIRERLLSVLQVMAPLEAPGQMVLTEVPTELLELMEWPVEL
jgi:hypothetical protein